MTGWKAASSIVVVSRTTGRLLMMQRGATASFMPNAVVFPGGVVHTSDEKLGHPGKVAAIRELFEETGLLLGSSVQSAATSRELEEIQEKTKTDVESFKLACPSPPVDQLLEWNTWLTPSSYKQRFMTSFYIIRIEGEPQIRMCEKEMVHYSWMAPKDCLERASKGEVVLPPPQVYELTRVSQTPCEELHKHGNTKYVLCPQHIGWQDQPFITNALPGDHLYIDDDAYHQPPRSMSLEAIKVDPQKPTHRVEYCSKPLYTKCKIYMHNLSAKHRNSFHQFETSSKKIAAVGISSRKMWDRSI